MGIERVPDKETMPAEEEMLDTTAASMDPRLMAMGSKAPAEPPQDVWADANNKTTLLEGVPNLSDVGYDVIKYMVNCTNGFVYLGRSRKGLKDYVAIKRYTPENAQESESIAREASNLRQVSHENILALDACFVYEQCIYLITPAMNLGSLHDVLNYFEWGINEMAAAAIFTQILDALIYIHRRRYIHRDVRPSHVMIDSRGNVKLGGFRFLIEMNYRLDCVFDFDDHLQQQLYYFAPEVLAQNMHGYNTKSDVYMLGIMLCEVLNGVMPFAETDQLEMFYRKSCGQVPRPVDKQSLADDEKLGFDISTRPQEHRDREFSQELHQFVHDCFVLNPDTRASAKELKSSAWITSKANPTTFRPQDVMTHLMFNPKDFEFQLWKQEPLMPRQPQQTYDIAFDYSPLNVQ